MVGDNIKRLIDAALRTWRKGIRPVNCGYFSYVLGVGAMGKADERPTELCGACLIAAAACDIDPDVWRNRPETTGEYPSDVARRIVLERFGLTTGNLGEVVGGFDDWKHAGTRPICRAAALVAKRVLIHSDEEFDPESLEGVTAESILAGVA